MKSAAHFSRFLFAALLCCAFFHPAYAQRPDSLLAAKQVDSLVNLNRALVGKRQFNEALRVIGEAERVALAAFGRESAGYATCVFNHGRTFQFDKKHSDAEPLYLEAKAIQEKTPGKEHPDYAKTLTNLGLLYKDEAKYAKAEPLLQEALSIFKKKPGMKHPEYIAGLNNLAILYQDMGKFSELKLLYREFLDIQEKEPGKEHPYYATILFNLTALYQVMGNYTEAEPLLLKTLAIQEKTLTREHRDYAKGLSNLAALYQVMGNYAKAEQVCLEAKAIREKVLPKDDPDYAMSLNNLAALYFQMGNYTEAEPLYLKALAIQEKKPGREHPDYAASLLNLAVLYTNMSKYAEAKPRFLEARAIWEKSVGKEHPNYAMSLNGLANLYSKMGNYVEAEPLYLEAFAIQEKALGRKHPDYAMALNNLAGVYRFMGDYAKAESLYAALQPTLQTIFQNAATYTSEREMLRFAATFQKYEENTLFFTLAHPSDTLLFAAYDYALAQTNALLDAAIARENGIARADSSTRKLHADWKSRHFLLAKEYEKTINERNFARIDSLVAEAERYEKELVRRSPTFAESRREVRWRAVRDELEQGEAAIEFLRFRQLSINGQSDTTLYAALVLLPGANVPQMVRLFEQRQLDTLLASKTKKMDDQLRIDKNLYVAERIDDIPTLYQLLWQPLQPLLHSVKTIYYAPAGDLHRLNPAAIRAHEGAAPLGDSLHFVRLGSTRELALHDHKPDTAPAPKRDALLFGNIPYDMDTLKIRQSLDLTTASLQRKEDHNIPSDSNKGGDDRQPWPLLNDSKREITNIKSLLEGAGFQVAVREGYAASEEAFKQIGQQGPSPSILYVSTHGFFTEDSTTPTNGRASELAGFDAPRHVENPMLRSGLVFAGANLFRTTGQAARGFNDGILTAYDVTRMNLQGTDLVVLSACETGLGSVTGSESVFGLQRAFRLAGAKTLVMSLWKVPVEATTDLLTRFHQNWLTGKMSRREALKEAQRWMRGQVDEKGKKKYDSPYFWAGFVLVDF